MRVGVTVGGLWIAMLGCAVAAVPAQGQPWAGWRRDYDAPYVERRSECELLNSGFGLPRCDLYGPAYAPPYLGYGGYGDRGYDGYDEGGYDDYGPQEYGVNPYSRGYGVEGRGWQLP
jgi:hypothetical protein